MLSEVCVGLEVNPEPKNKIPPSLDAKPQQLVTTGNKNTGKNRYFILCTYILRNAYYECVRGVPTRSLGPAINLK